MTSRPESRVQKFDPRTRIVYLRDPFDGFVFATTFAGIDEQLAINPKLEIVESR